MSRRTCMVASDEEDEDGNLNEMEASSDKTTTEVLPGEVIYLAADTSGFQPEEEEITDRPIPVVYVNPDDSKVHMTRRTSQRVSKIKSYEMPQQEENDPFAQPEEEVSSNVRIKNIKPEPITSDEHIESKPIKSPVKIKSKLEETHFIPVKSIKSEPIEQEPVRENTVRNAIITTQNMKAASLMPPPMKRGNSFDANACKKAKYARQATPICDAIMKEYSKRQRISKTSGGPTVPDLSDLPIQKLLKKAKTVSEESAEGNNTANTTEKPTEKTEIVPKIDPKPIVNLQKDPLSVKVKLEPLDIKPIVRTVTEVKNEVDSPTLSRRRGRRPRRFEDIDLDDEDDPTYVPGMENTTNVRKTILTNSIQTRNINSRRGIVETPEKRSRGRPPKTSMMFSDNSNSSSTEVLLEENDSSQTTLGEGNLHGTSNSNVPMSEALNLATRLKSLAEKIANVLNNEPSPNIHDEAEKLLQATQELIKLQKEESQGNLQSVSSKNESTTDIPRKSLFNENDKPLDESTKIFNQLSMQYADLKKVLGQILMKNNAKNDSPVKSQNKNILTNTSGNTDSGTGDLFSSRSSSLQQKCAFVMDYFKSYQDVFDDDMYCKIIPTVTEITLLCMNGLSDCLQRLKSAQNFISHKIRKQEIDLAKSSYLKMLVDYGERFFPSFNIAIAKIMKANNPKALLVTFFLLITGLLFIKASKYKGQVHRVKKVLINMLRANNKYHPLIWQVLCTPDHVYESELKILINILKHFQQKRYITISDDRLLTSCFYDKENESFHSPDSAAWDLPVTDIFTPIPEGIDAFVDSNTHSELINLSDLSPGKQISSTQPSSSNDNSKSVSKLPDVAAKFVEALQSESQGDTKRIEEKLDSVLKFLSGKSDLQGLDSVLYSNPQTEKDTNEKLSTGTTPRMTRSNASPNIKRGNSKMGTQQTKSTVNQGSSPNEKNSMLAQLFENDHVGLDSLFTSYLKAMNENRVSIKSEPIDFDDENTESGNNNSIPQVHFVNVKEEPEEYVESNVSSKDTESLASLSDWRNLPSSQSSGTTDPSYFSSQDASGVFVESFSEEPVHFPKSEDVEFES